MLHCIYCNDRNFIHKNQILFWFQLKSNNNIHSQSLICEIAVLQTTSLNPPMRLSYSILLGTIISNYKAGGCKQLFCAGIDWQTVSSIKDSRVKYGWYTSMSTMLRDWLRWTVPSKNIYKDFRIIQITLNF